jgi:Dirigent-like protein
MNAICRLVILLTASLSINGVWAAERIKPLPNTMVVYIHQNQLNIVHPDGSTASENDQIGDLVTTTGDLYDGQNVTSVGSYWTQKITLGFDDKSNAVRSNLLFFNITDQSKPKLNGTLYVQGVNPTPPGSTHAQITLRPVVGGTGDFAGAHGTAKAEALGDTGTLIRVTFTFYR